LGIIVVLFAGINTAAALNSSILDAISGLPLSDQILFIAKEVDRLKLKDELRDACNLAEELYAVPVSYEDAHRVGAPVPEQVDELCGEVSRGTENQSVVKSCNFFSERLQGYTVAKGNCDRLTDEFNQKYGD